MSTIVYIATSIDGYISAPDGGVEWLNYVPAPQGDDLGFAEIVEIAKEKGFENLYVDGGKTIQNFLRSDLIDELIISEIPLLLGGGDQLFGSLDQRLDFELIGTEVLLSQIVQKRLRRKRD